MWRYVPLAEPPPPIRRCQCNAVAIECHDKAVLGSNLCYACYMNCIQPLHPDQQLPEGF